MAAQADGAPARGGRRSSIRLRLVAAGGAAVLVSLAIAAGGLVLLFERHVQRLAFLELSADLDQITASLVRQPDGTLALATPPSDPRYEQPLSGLYWQVETRDGVLVSRSLWDGTIRLPEAPRDGRPHEHVAPGPQGESLLMLERTLKAPLRFGEAGARVTVALDRGQLRAATRGFVRDLFPYLALLATVLIAAGWFQVAVGLRPLATVGARVAAVRSGTARRLGDDFPAEVRPLAAEVDALLDAREAEVARARTRAADLAHGLKTPLQALMGESERLRARGAADEAAGIEEVVTAMRRHVDRELARARIAFAGRAATCDPALVVPRLVAVLRRTRAGGDLAWEVDAPPGCLARIDADDLTEALGALFENAARHAAASVRISVGRAAGDRVAVAIRDDGPGIPEAALERLTGRGVRLDSGGPGAGLGLAIASDIAEAAGGSLSLANAVPGLVATLVLPAAPVNLTTA